MSRLMRWPVLLSGVLALSIGNAYADGIGNDAQPAHEMCAACHGLDGVSHMAKFPKLAGQNAEYILKQLEDFRLARRTNDGGQMETAATVITDAQRLEAAEYFSGLPPPPSSADISDELIVRGRELFEKPDLVVGVPACAACHSPSQANGSAAWIPHLAGQHRNYTAKQIQDFKSGLRTNDASGSMLAIAAKLSVQDIEAVAAFLEATPRSP